MKETTVKCIAVFLAALGAYAVCSILGWGESRTGAETSYDPVDGVILANLAFAMFSFRKLYRSGLPTPALALCVPIILFAGATIGAYSQFCDNLGEGCVEKYDFLSGLLWSFGSYVAMLFLLGFVWFITLPLRKQQRA